MSLYAVKNDECEWLGWEIYCDEPDWFDHGGFIWDARSIAEENVKLYGGHVVELVEAPVKVVVSEDEAEMLKKAKDTSVWRPAAVISDYAYNDAKDSDQEALLEDRLMRAYVNGWTVEKPKRWNVKAPKKWSGDDKHYWIKRQDGSLTWVYYKDRIPAQQFTAAEIEHYELGECERVEVTDDAD